jgi:hypothetical protein
MTIGQSAAADAHAANLSVHGQTWTRTADAALIQGVPAKLKHDDPKMVNAQDTDFPILVADSSLIGTLTAAQCMPTAGNGRLQKGDELTKTVGATTKYYRVSRADLEEANCLWTVILSPTY